MLFSLHFIRYYRLDDKTRKSKSFEQQQNCRSSDKIIELSIEDEEKRWQKKVRDYRTIYQPNKRRPIDV